MNSTVPTPIPFNNLKKGQKAKVSSISSGADVNRLMEMGLTVGTEFSVEKVAPLGDTVEIRLRGYSLCMRLGEAKHVLVELV
mgnify:CR=1 FL=1|jgi:ferrous iron transport protein A